MGREGVVAPQLLLVLVSHYVDFHDVIGDQAELAGLNKLCP